MPTSHSRIASLGIAAACGLAATLAGGAVLAGPASAATPATKYLLTTSDAQKLGFSVSAVKATATTNTGQKNCLIGAQESFENSQKQNGLISEVLVCKSTSDAQALFKTATKASTSTKVTPPKQLGGNAAERTTKHSTGVIYWQHGPVLEMTALAPVSSTAPAKALTSRQLHLLTAAALRQDSHRP